MPDIRNFALGDMVQVTSAIRGFGGTATTLQSAASLVVRFLYDNFCDGSGDRQLPLVRLYKTAPIRALSVDARAFAVRLADEDVDDDTRCLELIATAGIEADWNDPARSEGHRAIPLPSTEAIERLPMIARLLAQFGIDPIQVVRPDPTLMLRNDAAAFNVFHVPDPQQSSHVPAKGFVESAGIRSVIGFGGALPPGELFATILFSRAEVDRDTADMFASIGLSVKLALLPFVEDEVSNGE